MFGLEPKFQAGKLIREQLEENSIKVVRAPNLPMTINTLKADSVGKRPGIKVRHIAFNMSFLT